jgi:hypothetical protein
MVDVLEVAKVGRGNVETYGTLILKVSSFAGWLPPEAEL